MALTVTESNSPPRSKVEAEEANVEVRRSERTKCDFSFSVRHNLLYEIYKDHPEIFDP